VRKLLQILFSISFLVTLIFTNSLSLINRTSAATNYTLNIKDSTGQSVSTSQNDLIIITFKTKNINTDTNIINYYDKPPSTINLASSFETGENIYVYACSKYAISLDGYVFSQSQECRSDISSLKNITIKDFFNKGLSNYLYLLTPSNSWSPYSPTVTTHDLILKTTLSPNASGKIAIKIYGTDTSGKRIDDDDKIFEALKNGNKCFINAEITKKDDPTFKNPGASIMGLCSRSNFKSNIEISNLPNGTYNIVFKSTFDNSSTANWLTIGEITSIAVQDGQTVNKEFNIINTAENTTNQHLITFNVYRSSKNTEAATCDIKITSNIPGNSTTLQTKNKLDNPNFSENVKTVQYSLSKNENISINYTPHSNYKPLSADKNNIQKNWSTLGDTQKDITENISLTLTTESGESTTNENVVETGKNTGSRDMPATGEIAAPDNLQASFWTTGGAKEVTAQAPFFGETKTYNSMADYLNDFYYYAIWLITAIVIVMIIYGGYIIITSSGNPEGITKGRGIIVSALTALLVLILAYVILRIISPQIVENKWTDLPENGMNINDNTNNNPTPSNTPTKSTGTKDPNDTILDDISDDLHTPTLDETTS
jgi:hypothetical protein